MKITLGVFYGGNSSEHEISIITALQAIENIEKEKYDVLPIYISKDSKFYTGERLLDIKNYRNLNELIKSSSECTLLNSGNKIDVMTFPKSPFKKQLYGSFNVAVSCVHGTNVEDGCLSGFFEMLDVPYTGCGVLSSALGMDKYLSKIILKEAGIKVLEAIIINRDDFLKNESESLRLVELEFSYPVIVKPNNLGSSIGISIANNGEELLESLKTALSYSTKALVERAVTNLKEINCAVLGDETSAISSECEEPISSGKLLSFDDKYMSGQKGLKTGGGKNSGSSGMASLSRKLPADITKEQRDIIRSMAVSAFKAIGASGVVRCDFIIDEYSGEIFLNELNTIPGSLSFYLWEPLGIKYSELLDRLVRLAVKRKRDRADLTFSFDSNVLNMVNLKGSKASKR